VKAESIAKKLSRNWFN